MKQPRNQSVGFVLWLRESCLSHDGSVSDLRADREVCPLEIEAVETGLQAESSDWLTES